MAARDLSVFSLRMAMRLNSLELAEEVLDEMARLEQGGIERAPVEAVLALGNDYTGPLRM